MMKAKLKMIAPPRAPQDPGAGKAGTFSGGRGFLGRSSPATTRLPAQEMHSCVSALKCIVTLSVFVQVSAHLPVSDWREMLGGRQKKVKRKFEAD